MYVIRLNNFAIYNIRSKFDFHEKVKNGKNYFSNVICKYARYISFFVTFGSQDFSTFL